MLILSANRFGDIISSYKGHSIFAILLGTLFFLNPISIAMVLIGANLPDFDHDIKKINLYKMEIVGLVLFIALYIANLPYFIGIILCVLPIIFYFSNHRGFTHSLFGIIILSILIFLVVVMFVAILSPFFSSFEWVNLNENFFTQLPVSLIVIILAALTLNKKLIIPFLVLFLLSTLFSPEGLLNYVFSFHNSIFNYISYIVSSNSINFGFNYNFTDYIMIIFIFIPLFLGFLSHLILDSLTPAGIELFRPFSSKKFHKKFAGICFIFMLVLAILQYSSLIYIIMTYLQNISYF